MDLLFWILPALLVAVGGAVVAGIVWHDRRKARERRAELEAHDRYRRTHPDSPYAQESDPPRHW